MFNILCAKFFRFLPLIISFSLIDASLVPAQNYAEKSRELDRKAVEFYRGGNIPRLCLTSGRIWKSPKKP